MSSDLNVQVKRRNPGPERVSGVIERPRLIEKLRAVFEHKLTLISAPPGYGKTTLAAQFARQSPYPVLWHTIEERERDVPNLYAACLDTLAPIAPNIHELRFPLGYTAGEQAVLVAEYLRKNVSTRFVYVLDDVHHLALSPSAETWLRTFVACMPPNCHLMLVSRILPDLPLAEMIARREVLAIGQQELRFTLQEVQNLAYEMLGTLPPLQAIEELTVRLEGWPAGTVLALHPLPPDLERAMLSGGEGPEALFDVLASAMLQNQPPALRHFLLVSSTPMLVTPELCSQALGLRDTQERLAEAQIRNLFVVRTSGGLVYHTLFRNFLQRELMNSDPALFSSLHLRAARWYEAHDQIDSAVDHYMVGGNVTRAVALMERVARAYFAQGKVETLLTWRMQLAQANVEAPGLAYCCASAYTDRWKYEDAIQALNEAEAIFDARGETEHLIEVHIQRAMINLQKGEYRLAAEQAEQILGLVGVPDPLRGRALRVLGFANVQLGEVEYGVTLLESALALHRTDGNVYALTNLLQDLELAYTRLGRSEEAAACLREVVALRRSLGSGSALALALNNLGYYYHIHSDYSQALATLQEGLGIAARTMNRRAESYLMWSLGDLQRDRSAFDEAQQLYEKVLELAGNGEPILRTSVLNSASTLRRWQGNLYEAATLANNAAALAAEHNLALEGLVANALIWVTRVQADAREADAAHSALRAIDDTMARQNMHIERVRLLGLCAYAALLGDNVRLAEDYLSTALELGRSVGGLQPLVAEILHMEVLSALVARKPALARKMERELKALREAQVNQAHQMRIGHKVIANNTFSLRVYTLGSEVIERDGVRISGSEWKATTAREIFFYLLFSGPESREEISLVFWPESSARRVRGNFHTTLHRIRKALGDNVICYEHERYMLCPEVQVWCDAQEMESCVMRARLLSPRDPGTEEIWRRAVSLYRGPFLPGVVSRWAMARREALQEAYIEALIGLGECLRARQDVRGAIDLFKLASNVDPYREDIHRAIMCCYSDLGEKKQVLAHLQQLQVLLFKELAIEPSPETMALAKTLLN